MDEDYDNFDEYNDAADDWELEAAEEEAREKKRLEEKALLEQQKLQKRVKAPVRATEDAEKEESLDNDIVQAILDMKEKASSAADARTLMNKESLTSLTLIADMPVNTKEEAAAVGDAIATRVLEFAHSPHFNLLIGTLFQHLAQEFKTRNAMNAEALKVHVASEEAKRHLKKVKKAKGGRHEADGVAHQVAAEEELNNYDALNFHDVLDRGGATDVADDGDFM